METLLRKETIAKYDVLACKDNVEQIIREYISAKYRYSHFNPDSISTSKTESSSCDVSICYSDRVGNMVEFYIDNELEAIRIRKDIEYLKTKFTDMELDFFETVLLSKRPQSILEIKYGLSKAGLTPIRESCIVKSAMIFNVTVRKDN